MGPLGPIICFLECACLACVNMPTLHVCLFLCLCLSECEPGITILHMSINSLFIPTRNTFIRAN